MIRTDLQDVSCWPGKQEKHLGLHFPVCAYSLGKALSTVWDSVVDIWWTWILQMVTERQCYSKGFFSKNLGWGWCFFNWRRRHSEGKRNNKIIRFYFTCFCDLLMHKIFSTGRLIEGIICNWQILICFYIQHIKYGPYHFRFFFSFLILHPTNNLGLYSKWISP